MGNRLGEHARFRGHPQEIEGQSVERYSTNFALAFCSRPFAASLPLKEIQKCVPQFSDSRGIRRC